MKVWEILTQGGHLVILLAVLRAYWRLARKQERFSVEHEMLIDLLCNLTGVKRSDLPTRHKNGDSL